MNFASDNVTGVAPEIMDALRDVNESTAAMPYGSDGVTAELDDLYSEVFGAECLVFPVATGTAANSLSMSVMSPSFGAIYCLADSHINSDECGAPEFYTGGAKLISIAGENGKLTRPALEATIGNIGPARGVHVVQPAAISVAQASEVGTVYGPDEMREICGVARANDLLVHVDGARFANAVAGLGCHPGDLTVRAGVDAMSFGATKNGAMAAEAVIIFDPALAETLGFRRKRGAHLFSKMRFLSAQLAAYVKGGLWLKLAGHANAMADRLAAGLAQIDEVELLYPVDANMIFATFPAALVDRLHEEGFIFYHWGDADYPTVRLVASFNTDPDDVDHFVSAAQSVSVAA